MNGQADGWNQNEAVTETPPSQASADICVWWLDFLFLISNSERQSLFSHPSPRKGPLGSVVVSMQCGNRKVFPTEHCVLFVALQFL